jgi:hypothetical protein
MNCFQIIKTVLDEIYDEIPGSTNEERDASIRQALTYLSSRYRNLLDNPTPVDYSQPAVRFAYVYKYVTSHANFVSQKIGSAPQLRSLFEQNHVVVSCIGGGPGSDFLGILKYVMSNPQRPSLKCFLFDREEKWNEAWSDVDAKVDKSLSISTVFQRFDVTDPQEVGAHRKFIRQSDLFTLTYFMSEVHSQQALCAPFFTKLMLDAKSGAIFMYLDNDNPSFYGWFDGLARDNSLTTVDEKSLDLRLPFDEDKCDLEPYLTKFQPPKLTGKVAYRLSIKK